MGKPRPGPSVVDSLVFPCIVSSDGGPIQGFLTGCLSPPIVALTGALFFGAFAGSCYQGYVMWFLSGCSL
jgi:hypothetical protein